MRRNRLAGIFADKLAFHFADNSSESLDDLKVTAHRNILEKLALEHQVRRVLCLVNSYLDDSAVNGDDFANPDRLARNSVDGGRIVEQPLHRKGVLIKFDNFVRDGLDIPRRERFEVRNKDI